MKAVIGRTPRRLLALCLFVLCGAAFAQEQSALYLNDTATQYELRPYVQVLEDPDGALDFDTVRSPEYAWRFGLGPASSSDLNFGYSRSAYWLRFAIFGDVGTPEHWLLELAYPSLDRADLYAPDEFGRYQRVQNGDLLAFVNRPYPHRNLVFPLRLHGDSYTVLYLRVQSHGPVTVPLTLWRPVSLQQQDHISYATLSAYFGVLLVLGLYNLGLYAGMRERVFLSYVGYILSMLVAQASLTGLGNEFLWPHSPDWGNVALPVGISVTGLFGVLFTRDFLNTRLAAWWLDHSLFALAIGFALTALLGLFDFYRASSMGTVALGLLAPFVAIVAGIHCRKKGHAGALFFLFSWTLLALGANVLALRSIKLVPTNWFTTYSFQLGSASEFLLLSFAMAQRVRLLQRDKRRAQQDALVAREEAMETLRRSERDLAYRIAERTIELERANLKLRDSEEHLQHVAHHDALTGLANRILLYDRLGHALEQRQRDDRLLALLLIDLDGFKAVNDRYGHAAGDALLVELAARFRRSVRSADTVARLGGDEFVVVLEEVNQREEAQIVAQKLLDAASQPMESNQRLLQVGASVGIAMYPRHAQAIETLMRCADQAMYQAKQSGRNAWHMADDRAPI
jgi:diguanylate cyclase (GGDEF)-like protein